VSVAGLPDSAPARIAPAADDGSGDAGDSVEDVFSATLDARVAQSEREERHARRAGASDGANGVVAVAVAPPLPVDAPTPTLELGRPLAAGPEDSGRAEALTAGGVAGPAAGTAPEGDLDAAVAGSAPSGVEGSAPAKAQAAPSPALARLAGAAARAAAAGGGPLPSSSSAPALALTDAEIRALASGSAASVAAASSAAGAFTRARTGPQSSSSPAVTPTSTALPAGTAATTAKSMTVVNQPASGSLTISGSSSGRLREAMSFVANQAVLRKGAVGELDVPELGRVVIRAVKGAAGTVDVHITADRPETRGILHASTAAMAADLTEANVPVGQIQIDVSGTGASLGNRGASGDDIRRERALARRGNKENDAPTTGGKRRVRIVL
jgi:hypothetical protein